MELVGGGSVINGAYPAYFFIALVLYIVALVIVVPKLDDVSMLIPGCPCLSSTALCCNFDGTGTLEETRVVWLALYNLFCMASVFPSNVPSCVPSEVSSVDPLVQ